MPRMAQSPLATEPLFSPKLGGGSSSPPFSLKVSGPVLVCGNAFCLREDLERARAIYGQDVLVIAINGAAREVEAFALYSGHPERFIELRWIYHQARLFGDDFTVHSASKDAQKRASCPHVDHWWEGTRVAHGTSAWAARKMAHFMGFDLVVLCGAPLVPGNYAGGKFSDQMNNPEVMQRYCRIIKAETKWHEGCVSMSGATAEILGCPTSP